MSCVSGVLNDGMTVEFDAGPRLHYWVVASGQTVQYSGAAKPDAALEPTADAPDRLAGTLTIDDSKAGGPKVSVTFDAKIVKQFTK